MTQVSTKEDEKLFTQISNAIRDNKFEDLDELTASPQEEIEEEEETPEEDTPAAMPEETPEEETPVETGDDNTPAKSEEDEPEEDEDKKTKESTEEKDYQAKLKEALELIEKVKQENHALRSQAGRVPHLQRQVQQFDKKLEELKKLTTSPSSRPSAKLSEKISSHLSAIKDADPILAEALEKVLAEATDGVAEDLRNAEIESLQIQRQAAAEEYRKSEIDRLLQMYPNAPEVFRSASWKEWEENQSDRMKSLARSDDADDVAFAFEKYAEDMIKKYPELAVKEPEKKAPEKGQDDKARKIEAERRRKKESSVVVGSPSASGRQPKPDNEEALFREFSEQIRKELTGK